MNFVGGRMRMSNKDWVGVGVVWEEEGCCCSVLDFETH